MIWNKIYACRRLVDIISVMSLMVFSLSCRINLAEWIWILTSSVILIIWWLQSLFKNPFRVVDFMKLWSTLKDWIVLFLNVKELAVPIESTEGLKILVHRVSRVFQTSFWTAYIGIGFMLLFTSWCWIKLRKRIIVH